MVAIELFPSNCDPSCVIDTNDRTLLRSYSLFSLRKVGESFFQYPTIVSDVFVFTDIGRRLSGGLKS